jgi:hypothetical protein
MTHEPIELGSDWEKLGLLIFHNSILSREQVTRFCLVCLKFIESDLGTIVQ